jgi:hypothetical protein
MENKAYISGKITGLPIEVAYHNFNSAEITLMNEGFDVINPMTINHNHDLTWESYMKADLIAMLECTHIYMLKDWHLSKGANIEYNLAKDLGLKIIFQ